MLVLTVVVVEVMLVTVAVVDVLLVVVGVLQLVVVVTVIDKSSEENDWTSSSNVSSTPGSRISSSKTCPNGTMISERKKFQLMIKKYSEIIFIINHIIISVSFQCVQKSWRCKCEKEIEYKLKYGPTFKKQLISPCVIY